MCLACRNRTPIPAYPNPKRERGVLDIGCSRLQCHTQSVVASAAIKAHRLRSGFGLRCFIPNKNVLWREFYAPLLAVRRKVDNNIIVLCNNMSIEITQNDKEGLAWLIGSSENRRESRDLYYVRNLAASGEKRRPNAGYKRSESELNPPPADASRGLGGRKGVRLLWWWSSARGVAWIGLRAAWNCPPWGRVGRQSFLEDERVAAEPLNTASKSRLEFARRCSRSAMSSA